MIIQSAILKEGKIYTGRRHHNIIQSNPPRFFVGNHSIQGFVDDKGNFLDREQAAKHALECKQIEKLKFSSTDLFSEDLY